MSWCCSTKRKKRNVIYNVEADKPIELVTCAIKDYTSESDVNISHIKRLRKNCWQWILLARRFLLEGLGSSLRKREWISVLFMFNWNTEIVKTMGNKVALLIVMCSSVCSFYRITTWNWRGDMYGTAYLDMCLRENGYIHSMWTLLRHK